MLQFVIPIEFEVVCRSPLDHLSDQPIRLFNPWVWSSTHQLPTPFRQIVGKKRHATCICNVSLKIKKRNNLPNRYEHGEDRVESVI